MLFSTIKWIFISLTLIFLVHHLYTFLMNTLTVPKIKDLVNKPNEQYRDIFASMQKNANSNAVQPVQQQPAVEPYNAMMTANDMMSASMTDELSQYLTNLSTSPITDANATANAALIGEMIGSSSVKGGDSFSSFVAY
jgi:hypothetical protein